MSIKPTIILVPGAWHGPESFAPLTSRLEAAGYTVRGVHLPSVGGTKPTDGIQPDVDAIREAIEAAVAAEEDVLVFMHSYGSVPAGEAVKGLDKISRRKEGKTGGVSHLFYCAAFPLPKNSSLLDALGGKPLPWFRISENDTIVNPDDPRNVFYADVSEEEAEKHIKSLKPHSYQTMLSNTSWEPYRDIPSTYLYCEQDKALPYEVQKANIEGMKGVKWNTETLSTSHSPFLSEPEKLSRIVRSVAGETI